MRTKLAAGILSIISMGMLLSACDGESPVDIKAITSKPKAYVGSDTCKKCHLEHYDSWKMTLHSRMLQNAKKNKDALIVPVDAQAIRKDLAATGAEPSLPIDQLYIPKAQEIEYTIGSQWRQRYLVERKGTLYVAPVQYNADTGHWAAYNAKDWDKDPWILKCGGCHATGVDLEKKTFVEPGVGCESCHGKGSWHAALPKTAVFEKRQTIVNPAKLTMGVAVQICGSCHTRGQAVKNKDAGWPVGYEPGEALTAYFKSKRFEDEDIVTSYAEQFSVGHHQQYLDWQQSQHYREGVTCTSCHYVHQIGVPLTRSQTISAGSKQCFECHEILNKTSGHSIHSFANCVGCHMPRIAESAESGKLHSHVYKALLPLATIQNPKVPNSCQACHTHKNANLKELQEKAFPGSLDAW